MLKELLAGVPRALAKAITLIESSAEHDRHTASALLSKLPARKAFKIGLSGPPGAGKSTLIEALGNNFGKLAILTIDPSSPQTGGSLLGDKTRMQNLARNPNVFIRPSPAGSHLGGVTAHTRDTIKLCEAAGFDTIVIESVGVGQSESELAGLVDVFLLALPPGAGDEVQALKRGVFEMADAIIVNKHDGDLKAAAERSARNYKTALTMMGKNTPVFLVSALEKTGLEELLTYLKNHAKGHFIGV